MAGVTIHKGYEIRHVVDGYDIHDSNGVLVRHCIGIIGAVRHVDELVDATIPKFIGKPISLINTREHQRYWLPDRNYWFEIKISGRFAVHRVVHNETGRVCHEFKINVNHKHYQRFSLYAQKLAEKKYPRPFRRDRNGYKKKEQIVYTVVNTKAPDKALMEEVYFLHLAQMFKAQQVVQYPESTFEIVEITKGD